MKLVTSKNFLLGLAVLNAGFAVLCFSRGSVEIGTISLVSCILCVLSALIMDD